MTQDEY